MAVLFLHRADVHKSLLAAVITDGGKAGEFRFECRKFEPPASFNSGLMEKILGVDLAAMNIGNVRLGNIPFDLSGSANKSVVVVRTDGTGKTGLTKEFSFTPTARPATNKESFRLNDHSHPLRREYSGVELGCTHLGQGPLLRRRRLRWVASAIRNNAVYSTAISAVRMRRRAFGSACDPGWPGFDAP